MKIDAREIKKRTDLVEYLSSLGVDLKPIGSGDEYRGICPFHTEEEPSFHVNRQKGLWHCFGCGAGGDIISFVMKQQGITFRDALLIVAKTGNKGKSSILEAVAEYWHTCLSGSESARSYLERRGIGANEIIERYQVGFAPGGTRTRDRLLSCGFALEEIRAAGLVNRRGLDVFFGRVTFPLVEGGKVINVYGRSLSNRYRHMYLPARRDVIFNIENVAGGSAILTESVIDALSLIVLGFDNAVSSLSVNLTAHQIEVLAKRFSHIATTFDGDAAGRAGAQAAYALLRSHGVKAQTIELPEGSDINSLLMGGATPSVIRSLIRED